VGHKDRGEPKLVVQLAAGAAQLIARHRIERAERLVHQQEIALSRQRARNADALLLAAGKLRRQSIRIMRGQADPFERGSHIDRRRTGNAAGNQDILGHVHMREQADILEDIADRPPQPDRILIDDAAAFDQDPPLVRRVEAVDHPQQGRLAGSRCADQRHEAAGCNRQRQGIDGRNPIVTTGYLFEDQSGALIPRLRPNRQARR
jgi:hypothetical protein